MCWKCWVRPKCLLCLLLFLWVFCKYFSTCRIQNQLLHIVSMEHSLQVRCNSIWKWPLKNKWLAEQAIGCYSSKLFVHNYKKKLCKITYLCSVFNGLLHLMWCVGQIQFSNFCPSYSSLREGNVEEPGQCVKQQEHCRGAGTAVLGTDRGWVAQQELFGKKCEQCNE